MILETGTFTLRLQHGEDFALDWQLEKSEDQRTWENLPTAGYSVLHQIRKDERETSTLLLDIAAEGYLTINETGLLSWRIPRAVVNELPVGVWAHDVALVDTAGSPQYLVRGPVVVETRTSVQAAA